MEDTVFIFYHNDCTFESAAMAMSVHRTKKGAYKAMRKHIFETCVEWRDDGLLFGRRFCRYKFNFCKSWFIKEVEILP